MKTILISPPHYYLSQALGVPRLVGYLRAKGRDVVQKSVDAEIYDGLFAASYQCACFERIRRRLRTKESVKGDLSRLVARFRAFRGSQLYEVGLLGPDQGLESLLEQGQRVAEVVEEAHTSLRGQWTSLRAEAFERNLALVNLGALVVSLAYYPTSLDLCEGISTKYSPHKADGILVATRDREQNFLIDYYETTFVPWIVGCSPGLVGVSLGHFSQMIPGFTLLSLLRKALPGVHLVVGGATATQLAERLIESRPLGSLFDSLVKGFGEHALDKLIGVLEAGGSDLSSVPNLYYRGNGRFVPSSVWGEVPLDDVATPEYEGLRPRPILTIQTSTGCKWGKCVFCRYPAHIDASPYEGKQPYRERDLDLVVQDIKRLEAEHHPLFFNLADTSVPAARLGLLAERLLSEGIKTRFMSFVRAEKEFVSLDFCRKLADAGFCGGYFGLESACPRTNARMKKGVSLAVVEKLIDNFSKVGIVPNMFCIVGFPGETREEALRTRDFIRKHRSKLTGEISVAPFYLVENSVLWDKAEEFGIRPLPSPYDFPKIHPYEASGGMSHDEALALVKEIYKELESAYLGDRFVLQMVKRVPISASAPSDVVAGTPQPEVVQCDEIRARHTRPGRRC